MPNLTPLFLNNVSSTVQAGSSAIGSATATGVNVATGDGANFGTIGTNQYIPAVIVDTSTSPETVKEYVYVTARSTDALTVVRQAEESSRYAASTTSIQSGYTIAAVGSAQGLNTAYGTRAMFHPRDYGYVGWNFDPIVMLSSSTSQPNLSGAIFCARVPLPATVSITNVVLIMSAAGATLTTGQNFVGVYSSTGTRLGVSADITTTFTGTTGYLTIPISGGPISAGSVLDSYVYVGLLYNGTTGPTFRGLAVANQTTQIFQGATIDRYQRTAAGNTSLPTTLPAFASATIAAVPWVALS